MTVRLFDRKESLRLIRKVLKTLGILVCAIVLAALAFIGWLSITEFKPADTEAVTVEGNAGDAGSTISKDKAFSIVSWNIGYGGLSKEADFFMDGGKNDCFSEDSTV